MIWTPRQRMNDTGSATGAIARPPRPHWERGGEQRRQYPQQQQQNPSHPPRQQYQQQRQYQQRSQLQQEQQIDSPAASNSYTTRQYDEGLESQDHAVLTRKITVYQKSARRNRWPDTDDNDSKVSSNEEQHWS